MLKKCTVSSTTIPSVTATTTATDKPTSPTKYPQIPNAIAAGNKFGIKLIKPIRRLRNAKINISEINVNAINEPNSMELILRSEICAKIIDKPVPGADLFDIFSCSQACAR